MAHSAGPSKLSKSSVAHLEYSHSTARFNTNDTYDGIDNDHSFSSSLDYEEGTTMVDEEGEDDRDREIWTPETSPISSDASSSTSDSSSPKQSIKISSPPSISINPSVPTLKAPKSPTIHPYRPSTTTRILPKPSRTLMTPLSSLSSHPPPTSHGHSYGLPKSQPLARALFARMANDNVPHAGLLGSQGRKLDSNKKQKIIVPTKPLRTTFELGLTASELARKA